MNKVRLNLDQLQVETFDMHPVRSGRGTVLGANIPPPTDPNRECKPIPISAICPPQTIAVTCPASCPETCPHTCGILCTAGCTETLSDCRFTGEPVCCV
ncbi:MAG TPA: hypothetical protein VFS20_33895 [Longimicrobium sp.]|nr:hypothetical protein [Longimicrobium sp.]